MALNFEWDANKAKSNLGKHGISFEEASIIFGDPRSLTIQIRCIRTWKALGLQLKLIRCPRSLAPTLVTLPSMPLIRQLHC